MMRSYHELKDLCHFGEGNWRLSKSGKIQFSVKIFQLLSSSVYQILIFSVFQFRSFSVTQCQLPVTQFFTYSVSKCFNVSVSWANQSITTWHAWKAKHKNAVKKSTKEAWKVAWKEAGSKVAFDVVGYKLKSIWMSKEQQQPGPTAACRMRFYERDCINHVSVVLKDDRTTLLLQNTSLCHNSQYSQDYYEKMRGTKSFKSYEYDAWLQFKWLLLTPKLK